MSSHGERSASEGTSKGIGTEWVYPMKSIVSVRPDLNRSSTDPTLRPNGEHRPRSSISLASLSFITALPFIESDKTPNSPSPPPASPITRLPLAHSLSYTSNGSTPLDAQDSITTIDVNVASPESSVQKDSPVGGPHGRSTIKQETYITQQANRSIEGERIQTEMGEYWIASREEDYPLGRKEVGAIQSFGVLLVLQEDEDGAFRVIMVSENSKEILSLSPLSLFFSPSFTSFLTASSSEDLTDALDSDLEAEDIDKLRQHITLTGFGDSSTPGEARIPWKVDAAFYRPDRINRPELSVLELETFNDLRTPLTIRKEGKIDRVIEKPLRALRKSKGKGRCREGLDSIALLTQVEQRMGAAQDMETLLNITASTIREITGYDNVFIQRFDLDWNADCVAEDADIPRYAGLTFPASDFPPQARDRLLQNRLFLLYDRDATSSRLCYRSRKDFDICLDLSRCTLKCCSSPEVKYLKNVGIRSAATITITHFGQLWGCVSLQSYGPHPHRIPTSMRPVCHLIGESIGRYLEKFSYERRFRAKQLINGCQTQAEETAYAYMVAAPDELLRLFDADYACLNIGDSVQMMGIGTKTPEVAAFIQLFLERGPETLQISQNASADYPDIDCQSIGGLLYVPLGNEEDFLIFFRVAETRVVHWAGNPREGTLSDSEPRKSLNTWKETVHGRCRPWKEEEVETSSIMCIVYGKFLDVWREKQNVMEANRVTALLLSNASHEVRTPLNAIINYLELAIDGAEDPHMRQQLEKSHKASIAVRNVINDVVDLARGPQVLIETAFDLPTTIFDALAVPREAAVRKGLQLTVSSTGRTFATLLGDRIKVREILTTVVSNSVKHTASGSITVEYGECVEDVSSGHAPQEEDAVRMGITVTDTGVGISDLTLESIFKTFERGGQIDFLRESQRLISGTGLGLELVARLVSSMSGQIRIKSELEKGSKITVILPFRLPLPRSPLSMSTLPPESNATDDQ